MTLGRMEAVQKVASGFDAFNWQVTAIVSRLLMAESLLAQVWPLPRRCA